MNCRKCKYLGTDRGEEFKVGLCFRFPPQFTEVDPDKGPMFTPPAVGLDTSWCGEFKLAPQNLKGK